MNTSDQTIEFAYIGSAQYQRVTACSACGATITDHTSSQWVDRLPDENGHYPNQAAHVAFHQRVGF